MNGDNSETKLPQFCVDPVRNYAVYRIHTQRSYASGDSGRGLAESGTIRVSVTKLLWKK